jgi:adenylate cyclase
VHRAACEVAIAAARDALARVDAFNAQRAARGHAPIAFGIGLHVGDVMYGNIGVPSRVEFSVVGSAANHAARIETLCKMLGVPLLVSRQFASILPGDWVPLGWHALPGIECEQEVLTLTALAPASARTGGTAAALR